MPLLINIDTATDTASVCLSENGQTLAYLANTAQKEHASFVHKAIEIITTQAEKKLEQVDAFAVTSGPGSYTGLRIGMATAKGFCYAMRKPLITVNTLLVMAQAAISESDALEQHILLCPMIDARRMEVYTALYNYDLQVVLQPNAMLLNENSFTDWLQSHRIHFFGSGSKKFSGIANHQNAHFANVIQTAAHLATVAQRQYDKKQFADVAYAEPEYLKEFYSTVRV